MCSGLDLNEGQRVRQLDSEIMRLHKIPRTDFLMIVCRT